MSELHNHQRSAENRERERDAFQSHVPSLEAEKRRDISSRTRTRTKGPGF